MVDRTLKQACPVCGALSLGLPLVVAGLGFLGIRSYPEGDSGALGAYIVAGYSLIGSMIASIGLAIVSLVRREKWPALPCLALIINAIVAVLLIRFVI